VRSEAFIEESIKEVLEKADQEDDVLLPRSDECEIETNDRATIRLQRVKIQDLENKLIKLREDCQSIEVQSDRQLIGNIREGEGDREGECSSVGYQDQFGERTKQKQKTAD